MSWASRSQPQALGKVRLFLLVSNLKSERPRDRNPGSFSTPATALPKYTFSLDSLVDRTEKDAASEAGVARARQAIQLSTAQSDLQHGVDRTSDPLIEPTNEVDRGLLKSVMDQSTEKGGMQKIMQAMNRTEALNRPKTWSFFHQQAPNLTVERRPLPEECLSSSGWEAMLKGRIVGGPFSLMVLTAG